ncbi:hypothetical protein IKP85_07225 [bacterium]|nr:hypothetical protein [bacterium]
MNGVSNRVPINYTAANVGVLTPPDKLYRYSGLSDSEMEKSFREMDGDINRRQKRITFESRKKTPILVKLIVGIAGIVALWKGGKYVLKK